MHWRFALLCYQHREAEKNTQVKNRIQLKDREQKAPAITETSRGKTLFTLCTLYQFQFLLLFVRFELDKVFLNEFEGFMAKAINWPLTFRDEVIQEDPESLHLALRLGDLYYQNRYWVEDEVVDIRVNHKVIRKGVIVGDLKQKSLQELSSEDFALLKSSLKNLEAVQNFLGQTYQAAVTPDTRVTLVAYRNLPVNPDEIEAEDDPHM